MDRAPTPALGFLVPLAALLVVLAFGSGIPPRSASAAVPQALDAAAQLVLVTTPTWDAQRGTLRRYQRALPQAAAAGTDLRRPVGSAGGGWRPVGPPIPVVVGRAGLGWRADHGAPPPPPGAPVKREGDGRAPAGVLGLGALFGYAQAPPAGVRWPYHATTSADRCVDDAASPDYGRLTVAGGPGAADAGAAPWRSAELMRRSDDLYRHLIIVTYNMDPQHPVAGAGSCIFLHLWAAPDAPTAGCTAMSEPDLLTLARWLDPTSRPVLVQLPAALIPVLGPTWGLPSKI